MAPVRAVNEVFDSIQLRDALAAKNTRRWQTQMIMCWDYVLNSPKRILRGMKVAPVRAVNGVFDSIHLRRKTRVRQALSGGAAARI